MKVSAGHSWLVGAGAGAVAAVAVMGVVAASKECEKVVYRTKTETKVETRYLTFDEKWYRDDKDTFLDGARRNSIWTSSDGRTLSLRCFKLSVATDDPPRLDVRYTIETPIAARAVPDLAKKGPIELIVAVDGETIALVKSRAISHDFGISFLGDISTADLNKIASARKDVTVVPRQGGKHLDQITEFGVGELSTLVEPVLRACVGAAVNPPEVFPPPADTLLAKTKRSGTNRSGS